MSPARLHWSFALVAMLGSAPGGPREGGAPASSREPGPVLVLRATDAADDAAAERTGDRATALALASFAPEVRAQILAQIDYAAARLEARLVPVEDDLGDDEAPLDELQRSLSAYVPALTAAHALEREECGAGGLRVRVARSCGEAALAPDERCAPLWATNAPRAATEARARFLAWPASNAALFDARDEASARRIMSRLRATATEAGSPVALVLSKDDLENLDGAEHARFEASARRLGEAVAASGLTAPKTLEALARPRPAGRAAPWLEMKETSVLVVPRLSALASPERLSAAIDAAAGGAALSWAHRP